MSEEFKSYWGHIQTEVYLENVRMLFDYMQELNYRYRQKNQEQQGYIGYCGTGGLAHRAEILDKIREHIRQVTAECQNPDYKKGLCVPQLLYQHPLSSYLHFYMKRFPKSVREDDLANTIGQELAPMLNYFNILQYLTEEEFSSEREKPDHHAAIPYLYEDLCLSIREMTGCHACFLLYHEKGEMTESIARSGYVVDDEKGMLANVNLKISELDSIVKQFHATEDLKYPATGQPDICCTLMFSKPVDITDGIRRIIGKSELGSLWEEHSYLVFELPYFREERQGEGDRNFYLLLDYKTEPGSPLSDEEERTAALKVLFLRNRLWEALRQDYAELIDYRFDCSYIRPLRNDANISIMHITDIHLNNDSRWDTDGDICRALCDDIDQERKKAQERKEAVDLDLLAVTGDIVNASQHASDAQAKYRRVGRMLQKIAVHLWATPPDDASVRILPHDWKRRIMIVTGNHDYTAMNDVVVETGARKIKNALPAGDSGGTMSKFTYYIEFLIDFLDAPIDELLENDLNEIRDYKYLNLKVALINTSSKANSLQNNKVAINIDKVSRLIKTVPWRENNEQRNYVVLMHHAPGYKIDYFEDKYTVRKYDKKGGITREQYDLYFHLLQRMLDGNHIDPTEWADIKALLSARSCSSFLKSELRSDIETLIRILEKRMAKDEFYHSFLEKNRTLLQTQQEDQINFDAAYHIILDVPKVMVLAGHEHRCKHNDQGDKKIYVVARLHDGEREACIGDSRSGKETLCYFVAVPAKQQGKLHEITTSPKSKTVVQCPCKSSSGKLGLCHRDCPG